MSSLHFFDTVYWYTFYTASCKQKSY